MPRNLSFQLPLGLIGDPDATEQCSSSDFIAHAPVTEVDECPPGSVVGVASITIDEPEALHVTTVTVPLFNLVPSEGEPARFGFEAFGLVPVIIDTAVSPSSDYAVVASVKNATAIAGLLSTQVTLWGVPGDPATTRHAAGNASRGACTTKPVKSPRLALCRASLPETPLLTLPTSCAADLPRNPSAPRWKPTRGRNRDTSNPRRMCGPVRWKNRSASPIAPRCRSNRVSASRRKQRRCRLVHSASTPTGLSVTVKFPQAATMEPNPEGRGEADVSETTVTLPAGVQLNPSAANGLEACPETQREARRL